MLAQGLGLLEHADVYVRAVALREVRQLDRAGESGGPGPHDQHVQLHPVARAGGADRQQEAIQRQGRLVSGGADHAKCGMLNHGASLSPP